MKLRNYVCAWTAALILFAAALGQSPSPGLRGQVKDQTEASIPGAAVTIRGPVEQRKITNELGQYEFSNIPPGEYRVTIEKPGFMPYEVEFEIKEAVTLDVSLVVTLETQRVEVEDNPGGVSVDPSQNVGAIVLRGADLDMLSDDPDQLAQDLQALAGPAAGPNGGQIFIDGFSGGSLPPKSSIREIRINQNPFSAEYDRLGFGRIEIFTRPGTDKFRGQFMTGFSDNIFNARNPFVAERPTFQSRLFGGSLSGPLTKKSSFSFNIDQRALDEVAVINATILDANLVPQRFTSSFPTPQSRWNFGPRIDLQLNEKNTLVARYNHSRTTDENRGVGDFSLPSRAWDARDREHSFQLTETAVLSSRAINETRFQYLRSSDIQDGDNTIPAISVLDAFTGGGPQIGLSGSTRNSYEIHNLTTVTAGRHTWKFGGRLRTLSLTDRSPQNFGGTFTFAGGPAPVLDANLRPVLGEDGRPLIARIDSLERYRRTLLLLNQGFAPAQIRALGGGANQFSIAGGNPIADVSQTDLGVFLLDDWRVKPNFTLSYGLRYETQNNIRDWTNFAPRLSFAWGLDGGGGRQTKTVLRGGAGFFYDRVGENLTLEARRFNGQTQQQFIVMDPDFFPNVPPLDALEQNRVPQALRVVDSRLRAPYIMQTALGVDRQLPGKTSVSVTYTFSRGVRMLRARNVNAPLPDGALPFGDIGNLFLYESSGTMRQNQIITNINTRFSSRVTLFGFYMLNYARGDTDGPGTFPADSYDLRSEWGPTMFDVRHRVFLGGAVSAPFGVSFNPFVTASTGRPFNIITGRDNNGDTIFTDRPAFATDPNAPGVIATPWGLFNPNPQPGDTLVPRNYGRGPNQFSFNLRMSRTWGFGSRGESNPDEPPGPPPLMHGGRGGSGGPGGGPPGGGFIGRGGPPPALFGGSSGKKYSLTLAVSARNLFNFVNLSPPVGNLSSPLFGQSLSLAGGFGPMGSSAASNRRIDLQLRFTF